MNTSRHIESFLYPPLQHEDSFRLLELKCCGSNSQWEGRLVEHRLPPVESRATDGPAYIALSYAWGLPTFNTPNEESIEVSLSLTEALGSILHAKEEHGTLAIWIDQFCINQRDKQEKEQQINLMWRIFSGATEVLGWLGPALEGSDEALDDIVMFAGATDEVSKQRCSQVVNSRFGVDPPMETLLSYIGNAVLLGTALRRRMLQFFGLPWFQRRWIAQEVCLASNLVIHCGLQSVSGEQLFRAIKVLQELRLGVVSPWVQRGFRNAFALLDTRELVRRKAGSHDPVSLVHVAQRLGFLDCREDQDRVNALYGIVRAQSSWFKPAYYPTTPDLYKKLAIEHMKHFRSYDILHFAGITDGARHDVHLGEGKSILTIAWPARDLPSWVPDWRIRHWPLPMVRSETDRIEQADTTTAFSVPLDESCTTLTLKGRLLKTAIKPCSLPHLDRFEPKEDLQLQYSVDPWCNGMFVNFLGTVNPRWAAQYRACRTFQQWIRRLESDGEEPWDLIECFARTLIMDGRVKSYERPDCTVPRNETLPYFLEYAKLHLVADPTALTDDEFDAILHDESSRNKAANYGYLAEHVCRYRTMFVGDGGAVGLGCTGICPGDRICFFFRPWDSLGGTSCGSALRTAWRLLP